jgi:hypothetical protein
MLPKTTPANTAVAIVAAIVLAASYTSVQARAHSNGASAQTRIDPTHCVSSMTEEGARSAFPAWDICSGR